MFSHRHISVTNDSLLVTTNIVNTYMFSVINQSSLITLQLWQYNGATKVYGHRKLSDGIHLVTLFCWEWQTSSPLVEEDPIGTTILPENEYLTTILDRNCRPIFFIVLFFNLIYVCDHLMFKFVLVKKIMFKFAITIPKTLDFVRLLCCNQTSCRVADDKFWHVTWWDIALWVNILFIETSVCEDLFVLVDTCS